MSDLILPPETMLAPIQMNMARGNIGILLKLIDVRDGSSKEIVIGWKDVPKMIDGLQEWYEQNKPKSYHMFVDAGELGLKVEG